MREDPGFLNSAKKLEFELTSLLDENMVAAVSCLGAIFLKEGNELLYKKCMFF